MTKKEYTKITLTARTQITKLMMEAKEDNYQGVHEKWAFGVFILWSTLTTGCQREGDFDRVYELTEREQKNKKY